VIGRITTHHDCLLSCALKILVLGNTFTHLQLMGEFLLANCRFSHPSKNVIKLPSNLRLTTCECVHIDKDKDGDHTIQSIIAENPVLHANFLAPCFIQ